MSIPREIRAHGRLYRLVPRAEEPMTVHFMPRYRRLNDDTSTACGFDPWCMEGSSRRSEVTCGACRRTRVFRRV